MFTIRLADHSDLLAILEILNYYISNTNANLNSEPKDKVFIENWFDEHKKKDLPVLVCEIENEIAAYASLSTFRESAGYNKSPELSVYVLPRFFRLGIADALMSAIEKEGAKRGVHKLISVITASNAASIQLHEKHGFTVEGLLKEAGYKNGEYLDIVIMGKIL